MEKKKTGADPDDFRIISDSCIRVCKDTYLIRSDRGDGIVMLHAAVAGSDTAVLITVEKMPDSSMERIAGMFRDPYYMDRLNCAIKKIKQKRLFL